MMNPLQYLRERVWSELPPRVTPRQRILAALVWGGALMAWGAFKIWRLQHLAHPGSAVIPTVLIVIGATLCGLLLLPSPGASLYLALMRLFSVFGFVLSTILLTLVFYCFVTPLGWIMRRCGMDFIDVRPGVPPSWKEHQGRADRKRYYRLS